MVPYSSDSIKTLHSQADVHISFFIRKVDHQATFEFIQIPHFWWTNMSSTIADKWPVLLLAKNIILFIEGRHPANILWNHLILLIWGLSSTVPGPQLKKKATTKDMFPKGKLSLQMVSCGKYPKHKPLWKSTLSLSLGTSQTVIFGWCRPYAFSLFSTTVHPNQAMRQMTILCSLQTVLTTTVCNYKCAQ